MVYLSEANLARGGHTDPPPIHTPHPFAILARTLEGDWGGKSLFLHFPRPPPQSVSFTLSRNLQEWSEEVMQLAFMSGMSIDNIVVLRSIGADSAIIIANRWDGPDELLAAAAHIGHSLPPTGGHAPLDGMRASSNHRALAPHPAPNGDPPDTGGEA